MTADHLRFFYVVTPEYITYRGATDPPEAPEFGGDYWEGQAATRQEARKLALRAFRHQSRSYIDDSRHPMSGFKVIEVLPCPVHAELPESCNCAWEETDRELRWVREIADPDTDVSAPGRRQ